MQRQGKLVFVITSNNKVDIRSGCTGFSCVLRVASGVRKIIDYQFCSTILSTNYRLFNTLSINFIYFYFQDILHWNRPGTWLSTQLDFHLKKFAHFWMWLDEEAKMGLSLSVYCKFFVLRGSSWWLCAKNLQNFQSYRLNYRLFGKLTTI